MSQPPVKETDEVKTASPPVPSASDTSKGTPVSPLKGVKELLRMLWSNFLPDPTFDHAIQSLKKRDGHLGSYLGMDSAAGEGGYITAAEKRVLLSYSHAAM